MKAFIAVIVLALAAGCAGPTGQGVPPNMTDARFYTVQNGMTRDEVRSLLGVPLRTMAYPLNGTDSWEYIGYDTWGYYCEFSVTFGGDGRVASKISNRVNSGGNRGGA